MRNTEINATIGISQLNEVDSFIEIRKKNYDQFILILKRYPEHFIPLKKEGMSPLCFPFLMKDTLEKQRLNHYLQENGIETRPIISGNLLLQPFLHKYYDRSEYPNSDFIHKNGFYIGNNQFVDNERMDCLSRYIDNYFKDHAFH